jgi:diguanylate cyclase (GGDEF)-like protein
VLALTRRWPHPWLVNTESSPKTPRRRGGDTTKVEPVESPRDTQLATAGRVDSTSRRRLPSQIIDVDEEQSRRSAVDRARDAGAWSLILASCAGTVAIGWYLVSGEMTGTTWVMMGATLAFAAVWPIATKRTKDNEVAVGEIWDAAVTSPLTGLPNRTVFLVELERALVRSLRREEPMALMLIDVDDMKSINELCGRNVGDNVLIELGQRLDRHLRLSDVVTHTASDEFAVILEPTKGQDGAKACAHRIRDLIRMDVPMHGDTKRTTASIGIVMATPQSNAPELLTRAEEAVAVARQMGGNIVRCVDV